MADGRLDGTYTARELAEYQKNAAAQVYGSPAGKTGQVGASQGEVSGGGVAPAQTGVLPFTGADLALLVAGGLAILGVGIALRRLGKARA